MYHVLFSGTVLIIGGGIANFTNVAATFKVHTHTHTHTHTPSYTQTLKDQKCTFSDYMCDVVTGERKCSDRVYGQIVFLCDV